jgi:glycosyltransferase involved in cell wall biosynthesis
MKLLGIQIANGFSSEANVFASLLASRSGAYDALIIHQQGQNDKDGPARFAAEACVPVEPLDFGWRPSPPGGHQPLAKISQFFQLKTAIPKALKIARDYNPDIIYSNQQHWDCHVATALAQTLGKPQIIHLHYIIGPWLRKQPLQRLLNTDHVVAISDYIRAEAIKYGVTPERVTTVRNTVALPPEQDKSVGLEVRAELGIPADAPVIGIIARLAAGKGQDDTIEAFSSVAQKYPSARLIVAGDGEIRTALEAQANRLGVKERVIFTGFRSDVPRLLAAIDIFSHPSRQEPLGLAILEACAANLPVIACAEGGPCETIISGETGILIPPGDVKALTKAFSDLIEDPKWAKCLGNAAREHMQTHFRPEVAGEQFAQVLRQVAQQCSVY